MHENFEEILTRELRQVADRVEVPPLPDLPSDLPSRFVWQPVLAADFDLEGRLIATRGAHFPRGGGLHRPAPSARPGRLSSEAHRTEGSA